MASAASGSIPGDLGSLFDGGSLTGLNDRELIDRFRDGGASSSGAAFELLVARHGPMVQRVCRSVLSRPEDVEDAFQATFLVLARQSGSIRKLDSVASWLYGVAARIAARARVDAARRRRSEQHPVRLAVGTEPASNPAEELERDAFGPIVQEEVRRLPEKYRQVVLLCYWEGLTHEQAAHQLGCPIGTVRSLVARARELLRKRLARRGLDPEVALAAPLPLVSPNLLRSAVQPALRVLAGEPTAEVVSTHVAALVRHLLRSLLMIKLRSAAAVAVAAGLFLVVGASLLAGPKDDPKRPPKERAPQATAPEKPAASVPRSQLVHIIEPPDLLLVEVLEALPGRPISGERLVRPDGMISLGFYGDVYVAGLTVRQAKVKIVEHMRKFLEDEALGLVVIHPETGEPKQDKLGKIVTIEPGETDRVFVDVAAYNSTFYYVSGLVNCATPARLPITGNETVLDALSFVGGLAQGADPSRIHVLRSFPKGTPVQKFAVNYDEITAGTDMSTNYQLMPGDRVLVPGTPDAPAATTSGPRSNRSAQLPEEVRGSVHFNRGGSDVSIATPANQQQASGELERRLSTIEEKLDSLLNRLNAKKPQVPRDRATRRSAPAPEPRPRRGAVSEPSPFDAGRPEPSVPSPAPDR